MGDMESQIVWWTEVLIGIGGLGLQRWSLDLWEFTQLPVITLDLMSRTRYFLDDFSGGSAIPDSGRPSITQNFSITQNCLTTRNGGSWRLDEDTTMKYKAVLDEFCRQQRLPLVRPKATMSSIVSLDGEAWLANFDSDIASSKKMACNLLCKLVHDAAHGFAVHGCEPSVHAGIPEWKKFSVSLVLLSGQALPGRIS